MQCSYFDDFEQMKWKLAILKIEKGTRDKAIKLKSANPVVQGPVPLEMALHPTFLFDK